MSKAAPFSKPSMWCWRFAPRVTQYMWSRVRDTFEEQLLEVCGFREMQLAGFGAGMNELAAADSKMQSFLDGIGNTTRIYRRMPIQGANLQGAGFGWKSCGRIITRQRKEYGCIH